MKVLAVKISKAYIRGFKWFTYLVRTRLKVKKKRFIVIQTKPAMLGGGGLVISGRGKFVIL